MLVVDQEAFCSFPSSFVDNVVIATLMHNAPFERPNANPAQCQCMASTDYPVGLLSETSGEKRSREVALRGEPAFLTNQEVGVTHDRSSPRELGPRTDPKEAT
jgi:hypothetical protein